MGWPQKKDKKKEKKKDPDPHTPKSINPPFFSQIENLGIILRDIMVLKNWKLIATEKEKINFYSGNLCNMERGRLALV